MTNIYATPTAEELRFIYERAIAFKLAREKAAIDAAARERDLSESDRVAKLRLTRREARRLPKGLPLELRLKRFKQHKLWEAAANARAAATAEAWAAEQKARIEDEQRRALWAAEDEALRAAQRAARLERRKSVHFADGEAIWPIEKQRRSNVDWFAVAPDDVAWLQVRFERAKTIVAMYEAGVTKRVIAAKFGIKPYRIAYFQRIANRPLSPFEEWVAEKGDVAFLAMLKAKPALAFTQAKAEPVRDIWHLASKHALAA